MKNKPKYNLVQNILWMVKLAWRVRKRVLLFCVLAALVEVLYNLAQLYIAPEILRLVEQHAPLEQLLLTYEQRDLAMREENGRWRLTPKGFMVSNSIILQLLEAQQQSKPLSKVLR